MMREHSRETNKYDYIILRQCWLYMRDYDQIMLKIKHFLNIQDFVQPLYRSLKLYLKKRHTAYYKILF